MIVSTPLPLPRLEPDDWEKWWNLWNKFSQPLEKVGKTPNKEVGLHVGFDVYVTSKFKPSYQATFLDFSEHYPYLLEQIMSVPVEIYGARFVMSRGNFPAHIDNSITAWQVRNMFYCQDPEQQWYYTDLENKNKIFLKLPADTNWWAYKDGAVKHGTIFKETYPKIILQLFTHPVQTKEYVEKVINQFPEFSISVSV